MEVRVLIPSVLSVKLLSLSSSENSEVPETQARLALYDYESPDHLNRKRKSPYKDGKTTKSPTPSDPEEPTSSSTLLDIEKHSSSDSEETEISEKKSNNPETDTETESNKSNHNDENETTTDCDNEDSDGENEIGIGSSLRKSTKGHKSSKLSATKGQPLKEPRRVTIICREGLKRGTKFGPNDGQIQTLFLQEDELSPLEAHDIRLVFGCVDKTIKEEPSASDDGKSIRVCNWLRFLSTNGGQLSPNVLGRFTAPLGGGVEFEILRDLEQGSELLATFDIASLTQLRSAEGPLDLSPSQLAPPAKKKPYSTSFSISSVLQLGERDGGSPPRPILRTRARERSLLPCEVCGKAFDRPSLLKRHMRTHTGEKPHICDVCSKGFSTSSSLNTHRRIHSGEKPHQCPVCGKRFTASSNLYYHRMTHNKEKPHKCLLCGKSFPTPGDLKSHQYVHSGSWPYNCPICHRGFSKQTNLRNHLLLHSGDKPHNCHICNKKFALACNLRAHLRTHEEEPVSSCLACKRSFLSSLNMLVDGYCRPCLLTPSVKREPTPTNASGGPEPQKQILLPSEQGKHFPIFPTFASPFGIPATSQPNPFLEQLFLQWNYSRFAKETAAGSLGLIQMQQKLLESQVLAAQLMNSQQSVGVGFSVTDLLRATASASNSRGAGNGPFPHVPIDLNVTLNKFIP